MICKICSQESNKIFQAKILNKYYIDYFYCCNCGFLQTAEPFWLNEAYSSAISSLDTGLVQRNVSLSKFTTFFIYLFYKNKKYLDFAGGHGLLVRMMRDIGFDFYWQDLYAENIFARGFEFNQKLDFDLITTFESFEHFAEPIKEIERMLSISKNILFSTELLSYPAPKPDDWWYYALESGQHISFYSINTLNYIAKKFGLNFYSWGSIHLFTKDNLNKLKLSFFNRYRSDFMFNFLRKKLRSKTVQDMNFIKNNLNSKI